MRQHRHQPRAYQLRKDSVEEVQAILLMAGGKWMEERAQNNMLVNETTFLLQLTVMGEWLVYTHGLAKLGLTPEDLQQHILRSDLYPR